MSEVVSFANADPSDAEKKCTRESSTEKSSSKKQKTSNKEGVPSMLKKLIEELLTDNSNNEDLEESTEGAPDASLSSGNFFYLSSMIDQAEEKNKDATRNVIN